MRRVAMLLGAVAVLLATLGSAAYADQRPSSVATIGALPGIELPPSGSVNGSVDASGTADNAFWLYLERGATATFNLRAAAGSLLNVYLFAPGATDLNSPYVLGDYSHVYPTTDRIFATSSGYYFADIMAEHGTPGYALTYAISGAPNDRLPGVGAPSRPVVDFLESRWDRDDVSALSLRAGDRLTLQLGLDGAQPHSAGFNPSLAVYRPGATSLAPRDSSNPSLLVTKSLSAGGALSFVAASAGVYSFDAHAGQGYGGTSVSWSVTPIRPGIGRAPAASRLTYKRKARFTLSARFTDQYGYPLTGRSVYLLQSSNRGKTWRTRVRANTDSAGRVSVKFTARTKSTTYFRWYSPTSPTSKPAYSSAQKVVIR